MYALHLLPPQHVHHQHQEEGAREGEYGEGAGAVVRPRHSNVYIQGLPSTIEEEQLAELCGTYGTVESLRIVRLKEVSLELSRLPLAALAAPGL
jgi:hypothetical protein